jgi:hypothetical protein
MLPEFTAEAALTAMRGYRGQVQLDGGHAMIAAQQRKVMAGTSTVCTCPCCQQHNCGPFGWWSCLTCCDESGTIVE